MTQPEVGSNGWKSTAHCMVSGVPPIALENPEDWVPPMPGRTHKDIRSPRWTTSGQWKNVGKGSQKNGSTTSRKGLALKARHEGPSPEPVGYQWTTWATSAVRVGCRVSFGGWIGNGPFGASSSGIKQSTQNWYKQGEFNCLIKTKHCDGPYRCWRNVIYAQCSECQSEEIQPSAGKWQE